MEGPATRVVVLDGRSVVPGFIDAHVHPIDGGMTSMECDLYAVLGLEAYEAAIGAYAIAQPDRPWITGGGWSMSDFPGGTPRREVLDALVPDRPVILYNRDGHGIWVNSLALQIGGVDASTPDPFDGRIERDPDGTPTGMLQEGAIELVADHVPPATRRSGRGPAGGPAPASCAGHHRLAGRHRPAGGAGGIRRCSVPAAERSRPAGPAVEQQAWLEQIDELVERRDAATADGLTAGSVKLFVDGIIENRTAVTVEPYGSRWPAGRVERHPHDRGGPPEGGCRCARSARVPVPLPCDRRRRRPAGARRRPGRARRQWRGTTGTTSRTSS